MRKTIPLLLHGGPAALFFPWLEMGEETTDMPTRRLHRKAPSLTAVTFAFVAASAIVVGLMLFFLMRERLETYGRETMAAEIGVRADGVQTVLEHLLYDEWSRLKVLAQEVGADDPETIRRKLQTLAGEGSGLAWAGYAGLDGRIQASTGDVMFGEDVSATSWFQAGLSKPTAEDVHQATPQQGQGRLPRSVLFAAPVHNADGQARGVVFARIDLSSATVRLRDMARALDLDIVLIDSSGSIIMQTRGRAEDAPDLPSLQAARAGASMVSLERWPDGKSYFSAAVPEITYRDLPSLGWSLVARVPADLAVAPAEQLSRGMIFYLASFGLMLLLLTMIFVESFIRPFGLLARTASKIADGAEVYPPDTNRTRELQMITAAIVRLQTRLHRH
ncbi:MAG TPA: cache domain-containing protein [Rhizobium sp.]|nr:cache domain-containing protein [Rhizobium sp.]